MTATNHALAGAIIGALMPLEVAIPVALVSHFLLDAIPHYGILHEIRNGDSVYKTIVYSDTIIALFLGVIMLVLGKWSMFIGAAAGYFPDVMWVYFYFKHGRDMNIRPDNWFSRFHLGIQHEYPWGIYTELLVFAIMLPFFTSELLR